MRILVWHVHGGWMNAFLAGEHEYLLPAPDGERPALPEGASWVEDGDLRETDIDIVIVQRLEEFQMIRDLTGREPGRDLPAIFVEHNTPKEHPVSQQHPLGDQGTIPVVHVTHFNRLVWDNGRAPTLVIEHGIPDPGDLYSGELAAIGAVINEPVRRARVTGTDLLPAFASTAPIRVFGIDTDLLPRHLGLQEPQLEVLGDLPTEAMHHELARCRLYLHPFRWTSLGLALLEAMALGSPVVALAATEALRAVPPEAGALSTDPDELVAAAAEMLRDPDRSRERGAAARRFVLERYGLDRFLSAWDEVLADTAGPTAAPPTRGRLVPEPAAPDQQTKGPHR